LAFRLGGPHQEKRSWKGDGLGAEQLGGHAAPSFLVGFALASASAISF
jgi:hypothetical protein